MYLQAPGSDVRSGTVSGLTKQACNGCKKSIRSGVSSNGSAAARKFRMADLADPGAPLPPNLPLLLLILGHNTRATTPINSAAK